IRGERIVPVDPDAGFHFPCRAPRDFGVLLTKGYLPTSPSPSPAAGWPLADLLKKGYHLRHFKADLLAGLTVGVVALPLSMALAIASGVPPQHGLFTAIIAGFIVAVLGGARYNVTGPTAAFVVLLVPVSAQYGLGGLLIASVLAGGLLVTMGVVGLGRLIEFIPHPVTTGFTAGIAVVIATLQIKDFLGLTIEEMPEHYP